MGAPVRACAGSACGVDAMTARAPVSVVIPTFNAGPQLDRVLVALRAQRSPAHLEIIAIDSGSTDGTLERLRANGAFVLQTTAAEFNHGETRNAALGRASGDFAALLAQDAVPATPDWLTSLVRPFEDDLVAGSFGRQQPWPDASSLTAHYLRQWAAAQPESRTTGPLSRAAFAAMSPAERHRACAFDNVCSCLRLSVWRRHRFRRTAIAEDLQWAAEVLLAGHRIAYAPDAVVWHSHERSIGYELKRTYLVHQRLQEIFGLSTIPTAASLVRSIATTLPSHVRIAARDSKERRARAFLRGAGLALALPLGQYLGARSSREGREFLRARGV
jgi:rhamnosyltransferase